MDDCIFCKIVKGEVPAYKIYEDENTLAFLDIFPANKGQALVIPKEHTPAMFSQVDKDVMARTMNTAQEVSAKIEKSLQNVNRCVVVVEGFDVPHLHIKLYPTYEPDPAKDAVGKGGDKVDDKTLEDIHQKIIS